MVNAAGAAAKKEAAATQPEQPELTGLAAAMDYPNVLNRPAGVRVALGHGVWKIHPDGADWAVVVDGYLTIWKDQDVKLASYSPGAWKAVELYFPECEDEV